MPLRDHFYPKGKYSPRWDALHGYWPGEIVRYLFNVLPKGFRAAPSVHLGSAFEIDIATYERDSFVPTSESGEGGLATVSTLAPTLVVEVDLSEFDHYEVRIYEVLEEGDGLLVAAIEIVSPSNKDRPGSREAFASKVISLLQQDVCVSLIDLVTVRKSNLYSEVLNLLSVSDRNLATDLPPLYAATLRGQKRPNQQSSLLEAWYTPMAIGELLPTLPIWLSHDRHLMLPLEPSYEEACRVLRID